MVQSVFIWTVDHLGADAAGVIFSILTVWYVYTWLSGNLIPFRRHPRIDPNSVMASKIANQAHRVNQPEISTSLSYLEGKTK